MAADAVMKPRCENGADFCQPNDIGRQQGPALMVDFLA